MRMYKMVQIGKEGCKEYEIEIIDKGRYFCVNRKYLEVSKMLLIGHRIWKMWSKKTKMQTWINA